jgi:putative salt-induced outer membrane protein YdiY
MPVGRFLTLAFAGSLAAGLAGADDAPPPSPPPPPWTGNAAFGLSLTRGNADTDNISLTAVVQYDPKATNVFKADASYLRADSDGNATVDRSGVGARLEHKVGDRSFVFGEARHLRDAFKEISYLVTPVAGVGYALVKTQRTVFSVDGAVGAAFEKDDSLPSRTSGAVRFGEQFSWKVSPTATLMEGGTALYKTDDFSDSLYHGEVALAAAVAKKCELKVSFLDDFKNEPTNPTLKKNDIAIVAALVIKL